MLRIPVYYFARQLERDKSNHNVVYSSKYDGVWTPKYRRSVLGGVVAERCEGVIRQVASKYHADIMALELMPDPVHLRCEVCSECGYKQRPASLGSSVEVPGV